MNEEEEKMDRYKMQEKITKNATASFPNDGL